AKRCVSRLLSDDLRLSYVPDAEQRCWRTLTRTKYQLTRDRVRLQSQLESLLEECQIKLSSVVSDLLGASGQRILRAIPAGETDPAHLRALGDKRLQATGAVAHRLCRLIWRVLHEGVRYVEHGPTVNALTLKRRKQRLVTQLKKLGYSVQLTPITASSEVG